MLLSNQIFELEQQVEGMEVVVSVTKVARGNIYQISYILQKKQLSSFGPFVWGNVTTICSILVSLAVLI